MRAADPTATGRGRTAVGTRSGGATSLEDAVLAALAYADVFDWPLTAAEVHRTARVVATRADVEQALHRLVGGAVRRAGDLFVLFGRADLARRRHRAEIASRALWPRAERYGRLIAALPFVSMVAVSGSLAVNAAGDDADIDFFVVTADDRLWTARAMIVAVGRAAALGPRRRAALCPNYLVTESNLAMAERDCFTAHEIAQLVPLYGNRTLAELVERNDWFREHLPNHPGPRPRLAGEPRRVIPAAVAAGGGCAAGVVDRFERWEMRRKVTRLDNGTPSRETRFDAVTCKGHVDGHRERILASYSQRLSRLGVGP